VVGPIGSASGYSSGHGRSGKDEASPVFGRGVVVPCWRPNARRRAPKPSEPQAPPQDAPPWARACFGLGHVGSRHVGSRLPRAPSLCQTGGSGAARHRARNGRLCFRGLFVQEGFGFPTHREKSEGWQEPAVPYRHWCLLDSAAHLSRHPSRFLGDLRSPVSVVNSKALLALGAALPAVDLGPGRTALQLTLGEYHTCARLDDGSVKCWGYNLFGQLGLGDTQYRGDGRGEMGAALPAVDLGPGRTAPKLRRIRTRLVRGAAHREPRAEPRRHLD
jgi:hypothetical protein